MPPIVKPLDLIIPDWPAPEGVRACISTRSGGDSAMPWASLNLATHVGDDLRTVQSNRERLVAGLNSSMQIQWLDQVHGTSSVQARDDGAVPRADAAWSRTPGLACAVLTADCLPILICDREASVVAAIHAGWRGLAAGVIRSTLDTLAAKPQGLLAYLGPAICSRCFEVGAEVRECFLKGGGDRSWDSSWDSAQVAAVEACFQASPQRADHYLADLPGLARAQLRALGVNDIYGGDLCTLEMPELFYSYRRDGCTGRQAALIFLE